MRFSFARDCRGAITQYEALDGGKIENKIIDFPRLYAWVAAGIAVIVCVTVLICHFNPQTQNIHHTFNDNAKIQISSAGNGGLK